MPQSYCLTDEGLKIRNCRNLQEDEHVCFTSINPVAQALRDFLVSGPGLVPGIAVAGVCLQAQTYLNIYSPDTFYPDFAVISYETFITDSSVAY